MFFGDLQDASFVVGVTVIGNRTDWQHSFILKTVHQTVFGWNDCFKSIFVQKCFNLFFSAFLTGVIEIPWSFFFWPQEICDDLIGSDFGRALDFLYRNQIPNGTDSTVYTQVPVLNCDCQRHQLKDCINGIETASRFIDVFTESDCTFLPKSTNAIHWCIFMFTSQKPNMIRVLDLESHQ